MTNQTPESMITEVIEYHTSAIGSHWDGCYMAHTVYLTIKLRDMLREPGGPNDDLEEMSAVEEALRQVLERQEVWHCNRVWDAWSVGTMTQDDFSLVTEDPVAVEELVQAATSAMARATVPDAAFETCSHGSCRFECDRNCIGEGSPIEDCSAHGRTPRDLWEQIDKVAAERDAALAAIARVRAVHVRDEYGLCVACSWEYPDASYDAISNDVAWPCPTIAALEEAPEPEVKP